MQNTRLNGKRDYCNADCWNDKPMNGTEKVVEYLKMIQAVIDRLGRKSLWVKT